LKKVLFISLFFILVLSFIAYAQQTFKVVGINIDGNQKISKEEILKIINLPIGKEIDDKTIENIEKKLKDSSLFLSVNTIKNITKDGIILTFQLVENPLLIWISGIKFLGLKKTDINKLKNLLILPTIGWSTDIQVWNQRKLFLETGYFEDVQVSEEYIDGGVVLSFLFKEKAIIEDIKFSGLNRVSLETVKNIIGLKIGDSISMSLLEEKKELLEETNLFSKVDFSYTEKEGRGYIIFYFIENPIISKISFNGLLRITPSEVSNILELEGEIKANTIIPLKDIFYSDNLINLWTEKLLNTGFFEKVSFEKVVEGDKIIINIDFKENPLILGVFIEGNKNLSKDKIISLLSLRKKEFYSEEFLERKKEILINSGFFEKIDVKKINSISGVYLNFIVKENPVLSSLKFENLNLDEDLLRSAIILKIGDFINDNKIKEQIEKFEALGYFKDITVEKNVKQDNNIELTFRFIENPIIKKIEFQGLYSFLPEELKKIMRVKEGKPINFNLLKEDLEALQKYLQNRGFIFTTLQEFSFTEDGILILKYKEYQVENIKVEIQSATETSPLGFMSFLRKPTEENVVRREISLKIGESFNWEKVKYDLQRIYNSGIFEDVSVRLEPGSTDDKIKVIYVVKEKLTGSINFGGGYGMDSGFYGYIEYKEDNLLGKAQKLSLTLQITGFGKTNYQLSFKDPWFLGAKNNFELNLYDKKSSTETIIENEKKTIDEERAGGNFFFYYPVFGAFNLGLGFKYEKVWQSIASSTYTQSNIASINLSLIRDTRDFILSPTQGTRQVLTIEFAGGGSSSNFAKYQGIFQWHIPLTNREVITISQMKERQVLSIKASVGLSDGNLPSTELFTLGGANSIRGYVDNEFRGDSYINFTIQYRIPLQSGLYGVVFFDSGSTFNLKDVDSLNDIKLYNGIGIGIRYETIIIPIRLDFGYNFGNDPLDPNTKWRIHFSFGDVF